MISWRPSRYMAQIPECNRYVHFMCSGKLSPTHMASAVVYGSRSAEDAGWTAQLARRCQSHVRRRLETRCFRRQPGLFQYVYGALAAGASGFLLKHISPE